MRSIEMAGRQVPVVGQGTARLERCDRTAAVRALRSGLEAGATHVDTAELYGDGAVEAIVGEAIRGRRDEVFLVSKVKPERASEGELGRACRESLRRLGVDRLDLYLLHWVGPHPLAETVGGFRKLREEGLIGAWGVSNFDETKLAEVRAVEGGTEVACNQVLYHLEERAIEHRVIPFCREHDIPVVGYSPFGSGSFPSRGRGRRTLDEIAALHGATPRQVALAFLTRDRGIAAVPRTCDPDHARANAAAGGLVLGPDECRRLDEAFPRGPWRGGVPMP